MHSVLMPTSSLAATPLSAGDERYGCRPCQLAINVQLFARGEPLLPKGGRCCGACAAAGLAQLPESRRKRMYEMIDCGRFWQPSRLLRLSGSPATFAWVDAAHAARFEVSDAAEAAADDGWEPLPAEQLHTGEAAEIHGWGSAWVQLADPVASWAAWERAAAAEAEREERERERAAAQERAAAKAAKAAKRERRRQEREERAVAQLWEAAARAAAQAAEREQRRQERAVAQRRAAALYASEQAAQRREAAVSAARVAYAAAEADGTAEALAEDGWEAVPLVLDAAEVAAVHWAGTAWAPIRR